MLVNSQSLTDHFLANSQLASQATSASAIISPRKIWGNMLTALREQREIGLHISCTSDAAPKLENNVFVLEVSTDFSFDMLSDEKSRESLKKAFAAAHYYGAFEVRKKELVKTAKQKDLEKITALAGSKLKHV